MHVFLLHSLCFTNDVSGGVAWWLAYQADTHRSRARISLLPRIFTFIVSEYFFLKVMYQNFELYNPCVILSAPIIIINHLLNVSYFGYILHTRLKSYISKFGAVQSLDNFICINNTYQPFAETFLFWLHPARKIQSTIWYRNTLYLRVWR